MYFILLIATLYVFFKVPRSSYSYLIILSPGFIILNYIYGNNIDEYLIFIIIVFILSIINYYELKYIYFLIPLLLYGIELFYRKDSLYLSPILLPLLIQGRFNVNWKILAVATLFIFVGVLYYSSNTFLDLKLALITFSESFYRSSWVCLLALFPFFLFLSWQYRIIYLASGVFSLLGAFMGGLGWETWLAVYVSSSALMFIVSTSKNSTVALAVKRIPFYVVILYCSAWSVPSVQNNVGAFGLYSILDDTNLSRPKNFISNSFWKSVGHNKKSLVISQTFSSDVDIRSIVSSLRGAGIADVKYLPGSYGGGSKCDEFNSCPVYILDGREFARKRIPNFNPSEDLLARIDGSLVLAKGWLRCSSCKQISQPERIVNWPYRLQLGETTLFAKQSIGTQFLLNGWGEPEAWGVWSEGGEASFFLPMPTARPKNLDISLHAFITPGHPKIYVSIFANDIFIERMAINEARPPHIKIPMNDQNYPSGYVEVRFKVDSPISPFRLNLSGDTRSLGIGLVSATYE